MDKPAFQIIRMIRAALGLSACVALLSGCDTIAKAIKGETTPSSSSSSSKPNNSEPTISSVANITTNQDRSFNVSFTINDADGGLSCQSSMYVTVGDYTLLPVNSITRLGTAPNCIFQFKPSAGYWGSTTVQLKVYDGKYSASTSFTVTVLEGAATPTVTSATVNEGSAAVFTVSLKHTMPGPKTFTYATTDSTAIAGTNYTTTSGSVTFAAGETVKTISVPTIHDNTNSPNLAFGLIVNMDGTTATATGTLVNIDGLPTASASSVTAGEGANLTFTVNLTRASSANTLVTYATSNGTAVAGVNYTAASGTLTFTPGQTSKTVTIATLDDAVIGPDTTLTFTMSANGVTNTATGTITDVQGPASLTVGDITVNEGSSATYTVNLNHASSSSITVTYATANGTATAGTNYTSTSGSLIFTPGQTSKTVVVPTSADGIYTPNLTYNLSFSLAGATTTATGTITNTDAAPTASAIAASASEGNSITFTVNLDRTSSTVTAVTYSTTNGTAASGTNYTSSAGVLNIPAGQSSGTLTVPTLADTVYTPDLTFTLGLTTGGTTNNATGTVLNTDSAPTATVSNASANEGSNLTFTVTLNRASSATTSVAYASADGTAEAGTNYTAVSGTLSFLAGETSKTVTVTSLADSTYAPSLNFTFSATVNGVTNSGTGTIVNTDAVPTVSAANVAANEGSNLVFTVALNRASTSSTTVTYATTNGTASSGTNYTAASGSLVFLAGETSKTVTIASSADSVYTADLTFTLSLTLNGVVSTATGTVTNTDAAPTASASAASANEGSNITFTVNLNRTSSTATSVTYATSNGTAAAGTNYTSTSGTLNIAAGQSSGTISVPTTADSIHTANLTFTIALTTGGTTNNATGTVVNTDTAPTASVSNASANEGSNLTFTVSLNHASSSSTSVTYATSDGTAADGTNYTAASGTLTFLAGETSKTVTVASSADSTYSSNLTFTLSATANSVTNSGTGTIVNTDAAPTVSAANVAANEGSNLVFTVALNRASTSSTTVTYATTNGTASAGTNYTAASGSLTFLAGETSKTVTITSSADSIYTADLTFTLSLTLNGVVSTATGTVTNTDAAPTASASAASANEGSSITFTVNLNRVSSTVTAITYATSDGTAVAGTNYTNTSGTLNIAAGQSSGTISVPTSADSTYTSNLTFTLALTAGGTTNNATGTVVNTDTAPTASVSSPSANEGSNLSFTVALNHASSSSTSVAYASADGTAIDGTNYTGVSGTLTFLAGETSKTVTVASLADSKYSPSLTFTLSATANSVTNSGTGTVVNTDSVPAVSAANVSANEGSNLVFTVTLDHASTTSTSVTYATSDVTAKAGVNYTSASSTLTFLAGETSKTVTITSAADSTYSSNLTFTLSLTTNGVMYPATGTIVNTDTVPTVSVSELASSITEGNTATFYFTLDHASASAVQVSYSTSNTTATGGSDYAITSGTATIAAGDLSATINVVTYDDSSDEQDETFDMNITSATNATLGTLAVTETIQDTTLWFNFTSGSLPSGLTFARASSGTYYNSSGILQTAASGTARFDYDPSSCAGSCTIKGLLIEEGRTNLLLQSSTYDTTWSSSATTITANAATSPSGASDAYSLLATTSNNNTDLISQTVSLVASANYALSFYVKNSNATVSVYEVNAANSGTTGKSITLTWAGAVPSASSGTVQALPNGWYRVTTTFTTNSSDAGSASVSFYPSTQLQNGTVYLWGAQLEAGDIPTSYIPTTVATATRVADSLSISNFVNWFNATAFTAILDFSRPFYETSASTVTPTIFSACDSASGGTCSSDYFEAVHIPSDNTFRGRSAVSSSLVASSSYTNSSNLSDVKVQMGVSQSSAGALRTVVNGTAATVSGSATKPTLNSFLLGASGLASAPTKQVNGHLKKFTYRARTLTSAQMQALTSD